jgi:AICAR transformylase/IMP cyclohydrolase PurH
MTDPKQPHEGPTRKANNSDGTLAGVTLLRAAAKNHSRVTVLSDPADYHDCELLWQIL